MKLHHLIFIAILAGLTLLFASVSTPGIETSIGLALWNLIGLLGVYTLAEGWDLQAEYTAVAFAAAGVLVACMVFGLSLFTAMLGASVGVAVVVGGLWLLARFGNVQ